MMIKYEIGNLFPVPLYRVHGRDTRLKFLITKEIEDVVKTFVFQTGVFDTEWSKEEIHQISDNKWILNDSKFKKIRSFCEEHIDTYVEKIIGAAEGYEFYITQSWLNILKPGQEHGRHHHANSIISGIFYIKNAANSAINFYDPTNTKRDLCMNRKPFTPYNTLIASIVVEDGDLILFPGWLEHSVNKNNNTTDRISLAFNVFAKGTYGKEDELNLLYIK